MSLPVKYHSRQGLKLLYYRLNLDKTDKISILKYVVDLDLNTSFAFGIPRASCKVGRPNTLSQFTSAIGFKELLLLSPEVLK